MGVSTGKGNPQIAYDGEVSTEPADRDSFESPRRPRPAHGPSTAIDNDRDIELVLAFLNTCDAETGTELLADPRAWHDWCVERGWQTAPEASAAQEVRDLLRTAITCGENTATVMSAAPRWPARVDLTTGVPVVTGQDAVGAILTAAARLVTAGQWERVKICPAEDCLWAFFDRSRNRSRTWCSMRVCGNRKKARSWRERHTISE